MCELLGMSANTPTDIVFSVTGLIERGGRTGPHRDGWGIAFYEGKGCRLFRDPSASTDSKVAQFVKQYPIKSKVVISHIRRANRGKICLENTHPFVREMWGRMWCFAHNGQLKGIKKRGLKFYQPVGTTDSEHAFCWILDRIREQFPKPPSNPNQLHRYVAELGWELDALGVANFMLSDSRYLYSHCSTRMCWITRKAPFGAAQLIDAEVSVDFATETTPNDIVTVVATQPLTDNEQWHKMEKGELRVFEAGLSKRLR
ncbi:MAG: class II glutamine amidotransferase [Salinisphaeraceae bacterium]|nr:class II glutamine amidotransferase [Salinisphaeraceae bacterium]